MGKLRLTKAQCAMLRRADKFSIGPEGAEWHTANAMLAKGLLTQAESASWCVRFKLTPAGRAALKDQPHDS